MAYADARMPKKEDDYEPNITLVLAWYCSPISLPVSGYGKFHHTIATKGVPQTSCQHQRQFGCQSNTLALTAAVSVKSKKKISNIGENYLRKTVPRDIWGEPENYQRGRFTPPQQ